MVWVEGVSGLTPRDCRFFCFLAVCFICDESAGWLVRLAWEQSRSWLLEAQGAGAGSGFVAYDSVFDL